MTDIRKPGVCYAKTVSGQELPVIDVTNSAFFVAPPSETEMATLIKNSAAEQERFNRMPAFLRKPTLWLMSRQSILMRGLMGADGTFLGGMNTYLMKLGPDNLVLQRFEPCRLLAAYVLQCPPTASETSGSRISISPNARSRQGGRDMRGGPRHPKAVGGRHQDSTGPHGCKSTNSGKRSSWWNAR